jgi:tetratricopeptide (TPR) repeat protein
MDNVRAAIEYSFGHGDALSGAALIAAARELWQDLALYAEGLHRAELAMQLLPDDAPLAVRAGLWLVAAQLGNVLLLTLKSRDWGQRATDAFEILNDEPHLAYALQTLGFTLIRCGAHEDAETKLIRAQSIAERLGNRRIIARALLRRGHNAHAMGALERALPLYERCLSLSRTIEDDLYVGFALGHLANVYFSLGDLSQCISYGRAAREVFRQRKDAAKESNALGNLAECHIAMEQFAEAKETARASIEKALESESTVTAVYAVQHLAAIAAAERRPQTAARLLGYADAALPRLTPLRENEYTRNRALEMLHAQLGDEELGLLLREGAELSDDEAFALAAPREAPGADAP